MHSVVAESRRTFKVTAVELESQRPAPSRKVVRVATKTQPRWTVFARQTLMGLSLTLGARREDRR